MLEMTRTECDRMNNGLKQLEEIYQRILSKLQAFYLAHPELHVEAAEYLRNEGYEGDLFSIRDMVSQVLEEDRSGEISRWEK